jgi:hypothetical protein
MSVYVELSKIYRTKFVCFHFIPRNEIASAMVPLILISYIKLNAYTGPLSCRPSKWVHIFRSVLRQQISRVLNK